MDFGALPPEVNSVRMYAGPGSAPMVAAASAWNGLAAELSSAATGYETVITQLSSEGWLGPASAAMAEAVAPYVAWINHADIMFAGCFVDDRQVPSVVALNKDELQVLDTWHTLGLRGTGSHDCVADDVFVPADRVFSVFDGPIVDRPLYRFPVFGFFALSIGAAALGNARAAIDDLVELAGGKKGLGSTRTLAERSATQAAAATAESALGAARALFYEVIEAAWQVSHDAEAVPVTMRNRLRLAATHAVRTSADVVRSMYDLAGGTAIYDNAPLQRRFRDAFTATAHFQVNEASRELPGRVLLDQPADVSML